MINTINMVIAAATRLENTEAGLQFFLDEIHKSLANGRDGKLVVVTGPPGNGATHILKQLSLRYPDKYLRLNHDYFSYPLNFTERVADALGVLQPESGLRRTPRYILEIVKCSGRAIMIDDFDACVASIDGVARLREGLINFIAGIAEAKILVATKNNKFIKALIRPPLDQVQFFSVPGLLSPNAAVSFAGMYSQSLASILEVKVEVVACEKFKSLPVADMVAVIQVAMTVAMTRNNVKLDLSLVAKETDSYELTRFLEFASPYR